MRIAVDAMGGDKAPSIVIDGVYEAAGLYPNIEIILVGDQKVIEDELKNKGIDLPKNVLIHHCSEVVEMHESPVSALRKKKDSSILVATDIVKRGEAVSLITAGNTGAAVAATTLKWRMLEGVERPGIALPLPSLKGTSVLIDVGANIMCKPIHYYQYAIMGKVYSEIILKKQDLKVGLLNIGEEESKGGEDMKEINSLLKTSFPHFIGNVEGRDIFNGRCDVIVCDGFVGNIVLKVSEGVAETLAVITKRELKSSPITMVGAFLSLSAFKKVKKELDYAEHGGAPLLGVNGNCIICHGGSSSKAIKNAIRVAGECVERNVNEKIITEIRQHNVI